ncbi:MULTISPECIES: ABC transporter ATP-binding protein [Paenibacillus]|uniref:ATP-binding cassette domain-containing protein n=1 Tax=Paenibacillus campinasensis TaxID=66347 RepID=A0A268EDY4_9BACL|nr:MULTISPECIES: ABC transporter ATP-binding protein [Paenibacillus]MUG65373.1 ATP-binding cassette domain-containing protein [Paenibacillus campinasensis]PAD71327.1 bacitracin ABC transporter ATP-binding protein [Paenibacillus campinasensis]PAK49581.1 bacitracin ABC transporter ATP-binding protein [Paenibacillus sp. 7541]
MTDMVIQTKGLYKLYKKRAAVEDLNLEIARGDIYGFLGPNGAGKTTTIRMLLGLIQPTRGSIHLFGKDLKKEKMDILRRTGSLVEYPSYYGHLTAIENLETIRRITGGPKARIAEVLDIVSLTKEAKRPVKGYSLGMKQRLGIAAALLNHPELLILDEPTNGLDPSGIQEIRELIKQMPRQFGITVLVSSHLLSEVELMADKVGIIREGRLVYQDTITNLTAAASSGFRLSVSEPEAALMHALELGCSGVLNRGMMELGAMSDAKVALLVKRLVEHQHAVYRVEEKRRSLEDIFMQIVGEGNRI